MSDKPLQNWASDLDQGARLQAEKTNRLSIITMPVALMPDAHLGIGSTIGSVIPTEGTIIPAAVGVDIGCGMIATRTDLTTNDLPDTMQPLVSEFGRSIPSGVGQANKHISSRAMYWMLKHPLRENVSNDLKSRASKQLGSLGSGNHFLEVCLDESNNIWIMLHSGSRGIGNKLAVQHINIAKTLVHGLEDPDLAYFTQGTQEFNLYINDMLWAQSYALENREIMMNAALNQLFRYVKKGKELERIQCHHNFAIKEMHFGKEMWITRKGAISARKGEMGIIPGSMATGSYIVRGLGNPLSYNSSSHGAGRRMSRSQAKRTLTVESLQERMGTKAWNSDKSVALLDEHPDAYKDIKSVMNDQKDLTEIVHELHQILNYKGV